VIFFIFWPSKIRIIPTDAISSLSPHRCRLFSDRRCHTVTPCHVSFPWTQDVLTATASSFDNASSSRIPSRVKTKAFNLYHRNRPSSPDSLTPTLYYYKKLISILVTLLTIQPHLHFASSLTRVSCYRSSNRRRRSLSSSSHVYRLSVQ
jgi:hypothetical protein